MPSRHRLAAAALAALGIAVLAYSALLLSELLLGGTLCAFLLLAARGVYARDDDPGGREVVAWAVAGLLVAYGVLTGEALFGVLVAAVVYFVAWMTRVDPEAVLTPER